jgi:hypothetical protein
MPEAEGYPGSADPCSQLGSAGGPALLLPLLLGGKVHLLLRYRSHGYVDTVLYRPRVHWLAYTLIGGPSWSLLPYAAVAAAVVALWCASQSLCERKRDS